MPVKNTIDAIIVFRILKKLVTPYEQWKAYELGLIDAKGKKLKKASTSDEKSAMTLVDRLTLNVKRLLSKVPGGNSKLASYIAALALLREHIENEYNKETATHLMEKLEEHKVGPKMKHDISTPEGYLAAMEEAIEEAMFSGAAIGGRFDGAQTNAATNATGMAAPSGPSKKRKSIDKILSR